MPTSQRPKDNRSISSRSWCKKPMNDLRIGEATRNFWVPYVSNRQYHRGNRNDPYEATRRRSKPIEYRWAFPETTCSHSSCGLKIYIEAPESFVITRGRSHANHLCSCDSRRGIPPVRCPVCRENTLLCMYSVTDKSRLGFWFELHEASEFVSLVSAKVSCERVESNE